MISKITSLALFFSMASAVGLAQSPGLSGNGIYFIENKGQVIDASGNLRPDILFSGNVAGANIFLRKGGLSYVLTRTEGLEALDRLNELKRSGGIDQMQVDHMLDSIRNQLPLSIQRIDVEFSGANVEAKIRTENPAEGKYNYYLGHCQKGITGVNSFGKITYEKIYPLVDVSFYGAEAGGLEYDFIVYPGGDPDDIQLKYNGTEGISLTEEGKLLIRTHVGEIKEWIPSTYQNINGRKVEVAANYELDGNIIKFHVENFDRALPLTIDPWCTWITYFGGSSSDFFRDISTDSNGNVSVIGSTQSINFPVLAGFQMGKANGWDAIAAKFNSSGGLQWSTFYGGSGTDQGQGVSNDGNGNVFITGFTSSTNFPVASATQPNLGGGVDAFVVKFNGFGTRIWATYYGGNLTDESYDIACDPVGSAFITGRTYGNFPTFAGFQTVFGGSGNVDAFVVKFDNSGVPQWSTYCGGNIDDVAWRIATDLSGNVFITGQTSSPNFPVLSGFQMSLPSIADAYVVKLSGAGALVWGTYYGGSTGSWANGIATDMSGSVFITGTTTASDLPVLSAFQPTNGGGSGSFDAFVVKFSDVGIRQWATYYGGSNYEHGYGIVTDNNGNSYICGDVASVDFPVSGGACQPLPGASLDCYLVAFDPAGNRLCSTYIGGGLQDGGGTQNLSLFGQYVYLTALTRGSFPVTAGSYQTTHGGIDDAFIAQLPKDCSCSTVLSLNAYSSPTCPSQCTGTATAMASCGTPSFTYLWNNGQTTQIATGLCTGIYTVTVTDGVSTVVSATTTVIASSLPVPVVTGNASICAGQNVTLNASGGITYLWSTGATTSSINVSPTTNTSYTLTAIDAAGCSDAAIKVVIVDPLPIPIIFGDKTICVGQISTLTGSGGGTYLWSTGATTSSIIEAPTTNASYTLTATNNSGCSDTAIGTVIVNPLPVAVIAGSTSICLGQNTSLTASGGISYVWNTGASSSAVTVSPTTLTSYSVIVADGNSCTDNEFISVAVNPLPTANAGLDVSICTGSVTTLSSTGNGTYSWSPIAALSCTTCSNPVANPTATTSYTVTVSNSCGSIADSVNVTVTTSPSVSAGADATICVGATASLNASGSGTYLWSPTTGLSCSTCANPTASPTSSTNYSVTITDICGTASDVVSVTVETILASISSVSPICVGDSVILFASGGDSYAWNTGATTSSVVVYPSASTSYTVTTTSAFGCSDSASIAVTVSQPPVASASNATICSGEVVTLSASGGGNYFWNNGNTNSVINVAPTTNTTFSVVVSIGSCSDTAFAAIVVNPSPSVSISGNMTLCAGGISTLTATGSNNYSWNTGSTSTMINVSPSTTTSYTVTTSNGSCTSNASVTVVVSPQPTATTSGATICSGQSTILSAAGGGNYSWSNGSTNSTINVSPVTNTSYSVVVSIGTCSDTANATVVVNPSPVVNVSGNVTITQGQSTTLTASGGGTYSWSNGSNDSLLTVFPSTSTLYCVTISNSYNCKDSTCLTVNVIVEPLDCSNTGELYIPNAFSPNGDSENDELRVYYGNFECIESLSIRIFNRWGETVFESSDIEFKWDGTYLGEKLESGVYTYSMHATMIDDSAISRTGNVNLLR